MTHFDRTTSRAVRFAGCGRARRTFALILFALSLFTGRATAQLCRDPRDTRYVDAVNGDDVTGDGSLVAPWKTLTHALAAGLWDTRIELAPGLYDGPGNGETFPLVVDWAVSVRGSTLAPSVIRTDGNDGLHVVANAFALTDCGTIENLLIDSGTSPPSGYGIRLEGCLFDCLRHNEIRGFERGVSRDYLRTDMDNLPRTLLGQADSNLLVGNDVGIYHRVGGTTNTLEDRAFIVNNVILDGWIGVEIDYPVFPHNVTSSARIVHNTISRHSHDGLRVDQAQAAVWGAVLVAGNIFAANARFGVDASLYRAQIEHNDFWLNGSGDFVGASSSSGNLNVDPQFVAPADDDFRLQPSSPCIDAGLNSGLAHDHANGPRPLDGDGDFVAVSDIGAYEHPATSPTIDLRRADFSAIDPPQPDRAAVFPFTSTNPLTPVIVPMFSSGNHDPEFGILTNPAVPLAFYQVDPAAGLELLLVKSQIIGTVRGFVR